jgi:hypothetical protein
MSSHPISHVGVVVCVVVCVGVGVGVLAVVPASLLGNQEFASNFAAVSLPVNRFVDALVGTEAAYPSSLRPHTRGAEGRMH